MSTVAAIPDRMSAASGPRRTVTGNVVPVAVAATPTSVTAPSNRAPGIASKPTSTAMPSRISRMRASGTAKPTSGAEPDTSMTTGCPGETFSFTSASTSAIAPAAGAVRRVYSTCRRARSSRCATDSTWAAADSAAAVAASRSVRAALSFS